MDEMKELVGLIDKTIKENSPKLAAMMAKSVFPPSYKKVTELEDGKWYWVRHIVENVWRACYVGLDCDDNQWLHQVGVGSTPVQSIDMVAYEFYLIPYPMAV